MKPTRVERGDQVVADAAADELAVEQDVVDVTDDDDLRAGIAALGEVVQHAQQLRAVAGQGFEHDQVWRRRAAERLDREGRAAHLHLQLRLVHAAVLRGRLDRTGDRGRLAEGMDRDSRHRRDDRAVRVDVSSRIQRAHLSVASSDRARDVGRLGLPRRGGIHALAPVFHDLHAAADIRAPFRPGADEVDGIVDLVCKRGLIGAAEIGVGLVLPGIEMRTAREILPPVAALAERPWPASW